MKVIRLTLLKIIMLAAVIHTGKSYPQGETITFLTLYPSPYGVYQNIRSTQDAWLATDSGNVGIGTTGPVDKLHIIGGNNTGLTVGNGTLRTRIVINSNIWPELRYQVAGTEYWRLGASHQTGSYGVNLGDWYIYDFSTNQMAFILRNDNGGTILSPNGGNVGIGTTSPNAKLSINGSISRDPANNKLYGTNSNTHVNLGENSTTGTVDYNYSYCTVSGGYSNTASMDYATVGGGYTNTASGNYATVGGGGSNTASAESATIGGGYKNTASGDYATIGGGENNLASDTQATILGGKNNIASNSQSFVGGGSDNTASGVLAVVGGGLNNTASGNYSVVAGGLNNTASGNYSFAAGRRAKSIHSGCFVWANNISDTDYSSTAENQFRIRAGSVYFGPDQKWDIAEFMDVAKDGGVSECEIVSIKSNDRLGKSTKPYDKNLIGVVSSKKTGTLFLGSEKSTHNDTVRLPITLKGGAYIKVNNENGLISIGDPITSSSKQGIGMKATKSGKIIGYAMEDMKDKEGEILVFVNLGYYISKKDYRKLEVRIRKLEKGISLLESKIFKR